MNLNTYKPYENLCDLFLARWRKFSVPRKIWNIPYLSEYKFLWHIIPDILLYIRVRIRSWIKVTCCLSYTIFPCLSLKLYSIKILLITKLEGFDIISKHEFNIYLCIKLWSIHSKLNIKSRNGLKVCFSTLKAVKNMLKNMFLNM